MLFKNSSKPGDLGWLPKIITTAQLYSKKYEPSFCTGSNPTCSVSEICNSENLWQWFQLEIRLTIFLQSTIINLCWALLTLSIFTDILSFTSCLTPISSAYAGFYLSSIMSQTLSHTWNNHSMQSIT